MSLFPWPPESSLHLLDHDDTLAPFALFEVASALNDRQDLDFVYSDSDEMDESGECRLLPYFKPDWSRTLMLCANYVTHLSVIRTRNAREAGGFRPELDGAQDWDFFLRVAGDGSRVAHIAKVLYHWRRGATSVAGVGLAAKPYAAAAQLGTLASHFAAAGKAVEPSLVRGDTVSSEVGLRGEAGGERRSGLGGFSREGGASGGAAHRERRLRYAGDRRPRVRGALKAGSRVVAVETEASQSTAEVLEPGGRKMPGRRDRFPGRESDLRGWLVARNNGAYSGP